MTIKPNGASQPDVLTKIMPALSSTSDMPGAGETITVNTPATSEAGGKKPEAAAAEPAKSDPSKDKTAKTEGDKGEAAAGDDKGAQPDGTEKKPKPKEGINERFSDLTAKRKAAETAAAEAETKRVAAETRADKLATDLEKALKAIEKVAPPEPDDVRPDRAKFDDPNKYDEALASWAERIGAKKAKAEAEAGFTAQRDKEAKDAAEAKRKEEADNLSKAWNERTTKAKAELPDFDDVIMNDEVQITETMGLAILHSDIGPQIAYHLGKNPAEAARIAALAPPKQLMAMGELTAALNAPPKVKTTETGEPINPLNSGRNAATAKTPDAESMEEYATRRQAELRLAPAQKGARS